MSQKNKTKKNLSTFCSSYDTKCKCKNDLRSVILLLIFPPVAEYTVDVFKHLFQNPTYCEVHFTELLRTLSCFCLHLVITIFCLFVF